MGMPEYPKILRELKKMGEASDEHALEQISNVAEQIRGLWNYAGAEVFEKFAPNVEALREEAARTEEFYDVWTSDLAEEDPTGAFLVEMEQILIDEDYGYEEMMLAAEFMRDTVSDMLWKQADVYLDEVDFDEMHEKMRQLHEGDEEA